MNFFHFQQLPAVRRERLAQNFDGVLKHWYIVSKVYTGFFLQSSVIANKAIQKSEASVQASSVPAAPTFWAWRRVPTASGSLVQPAPTCKTSNRKSQTRLFPSWKKWTTFWEVLPPGRTSISPKPPVQSADTTRRSSCRSRHGPPMSPWLLSTSAAFRSALTDGETDLQQVWPLNSILSSCRYTHPQL